MQAQIIAFIVSNFNPAYLSLEEKTDLFTVESDFCNSFCSAKEIHVGFRNTPIYKRMNPYIEK